MANSIRKIKISEEVQKEKEETNKCKFCFDEETAENPLISPCNCSGSIKFIHLKCL